MPLGYRVATGLQVRSTPDVGLVSQLCHPSAARVAGMQSVKEVPALGECSHMYFQQLFMLDLGPVRTGERSCSSDCWHLRWWWVLMIPSLPSLPRRRTPSSDSILAGETVWQRQDTLLSSLWSYSWLHAPQGLCRSPGALQCISSVTPDKINLFIVLVPFREGDESQATLVGDLADITSHHSF